jgi:hypothetical protein
MGENNGRHLEKCNDLKQPNACHYNFFLGKHLMANDFFLKKFIVASLIGIPRRVYLTLIDNNTSGTFLK